MPFPNYWTVRVREPDEFLKDSFFTGELTKGILMVFGYIDKDKVALQSFRFAKDKFSKEDVEEWLKSMDVEYIKLEAIVAETDIDTVIDVSDSYENKISEIKQALANSGLVCDSDEWDVLATLPEILIFMIKKDNKYHYFVANYKTTDGGGVEFTDIKNIEIEFVQCVNETAIHDENKEVSKNLNEVLDVDIILSEKQTDGKIRRGVVEHAQIADTINKNNRIYPKEVLREAVSNAKEFIARNGAMHMDSQHRIVDGKNFRDIRETVALLKEIDFVDDKYVRIGFDLVDTQAGKDFQALVDGGARFQVSQRGTGTSKFIRQEDGKNIEVVTSLHIEGFDFIPSGTASVEEADVLFLENMEVTQMEEKKELEQINEDNIQKDNNKIDQAQIIDLVTDLSISEEDDNMINEQIEALKQEIEKSKEELARIKQKELLEQCIIDKERILNDLISNDKYSAFTETQKKAIISKIKVDDLVGLCGTEEFKTVLEQRLNEEIDLASKILAETELKKLNIKEVNEDKGRVYVIRNEKRWMEAVDKISQRLEPEVKRRLGISEFYIADNHPAMSVINRMCERFEDLNYQKLLNEAGEEITQSDIGVKVATISRAIIPIAFRNVTAFDVCDVGNMTQRIENVMYSVWNAGITGDVHSDVSAIEIAEGGTIPTAGIQYVACPILAMRKSLKTRISSEAIATAKGTSMNPIEDTLTALGVDISRRVDQLLWYVMLAQAQRYSVGEVTSSYETLTKQSDGLTYKSANPAWIQYEYVKAYDSNGNPTSSKLVPLFGATSGNSLQAVVVGYGSTPTLLTYSTDYIINWADGSIKLTSTGVGKVGSNDVKAKYSYTKNAFTWSIIPPVGVTGYENLINLRQAVGRAKVAVASRHYNPNVIATSLSTEDMLTSSPMFTNSGATPADILDRFNNISVYAGMQSVKTSALPNDWILVFEKNACIYRNFIPLSISGSFKNTTNGDDEWIAEEYSGQDVPVKDKLSLVAIQDLNT